MINEALADRSHPAIVIGRYLLHRQIARGGMATIHIARLVGDEGFSRIVAAKRLHSEFAEDADFVAMFLDEARIASKIHHRNVVPVLDVVTTGEEVVLVQEYVHGAPLHWLLRTAYEAKTHVPINVAVSIACQVLAGLGAAHHAVDEIGTPLHIIHRDVSPQNIMIATDGTARLLDFGIAKATVIAHVTREGIFKGKLAYSAPEQIRSAATQQSDIYSLSVALWELLVGRRLHRNAQSEPELIEEIMSGQSPTITEALQEQREWLGPNRWKQLQAIEPILQKGMAVDVANRWNTAAEMEAALATAVAPASPAGVAGWLKSLGRDFLTERDQLIAAEEASWRRTSEHYPRRSSRIFTIPPTTGSSSIVTSAGFRRKAGIIVAASAAALLAMIALLVTWFGRSSDADVPAPAAKSVEADIDSDRATSAISAPRDDAAEAARDSGPAYIPIVRPPRNYPRPSQPSRSSSPERESRRSSSANSAPGPEVSGDCNPPYYFEGQKKVFKPACL
jgi:serine/threonine-protein kinase